MQIAKMSRIVLFIGLVILQILLSGCAAANPPSEGFPYDHPGDAIEIAEFIYGPQIKPTDFLNFWIVNKSQECIAFPYDLGEKIFIESINGWQSVNNTMEYQYQNDIVLTQSNGDHPSASVFVAPDLSNIAIKAPTNFKVVLTGRLCKDKNIVVEKTIPFTVAP